MEILLILCYPKLVFAPVVQWIECFPAEEEVARSNRAGRT